MIQAGAPVPEFTLRREDLSAFTREDLLGKRTLLVFYPNSFSSVCTDQLSIYDELRGDFAEHGLTLYAVSCDSFEVQAAFRRHLGVQMEFLSDWEPKGETCRALGVYHEFGMPERAMILVGNDGVVEWAYKGEHPGVLPGANLIFDALAAA